MYPQIAIDGPAGTGKSTVAKLVAERLGYTFVDTGALYRCVALAVVNEGLDANDSEAVGHLACRLQIRFSPLVAGCQQVYLDDVEVTTQIRTPEVSSMASRTSAIASVRAALLDQQRAFAERGPVVMEGRDIQTVVLPHASTKIFLTASPQVRAQRRFAELPAGSTTLAEVTADIIARDERDSSRAVAPLKPAADATIVDTSDLTIEQVVQAILTCAAQSALPPEV